MRIHIKQTEIESAIRDFIEKQGIRLRGKTVDIAFTATRTGAGITADIDIAEDVEASAAFILEDTEQPSPRPALAMAHKDSEPVIEKHEAVAVEAPSVEATSVAEEVQATPKSTSLFGS